MFPFSVVLQAKLERNKAKALAKQYKPQRKLPRQTEEGEEKERMDASIDLDMDGE